MFQLSPEDVEVSMTRPQDLPTELAQVKEVFHHHVRDLQDDIAQKIQELDPEIHLTEDLWDRKDHEGNEGGGGRTRAFQGEVIENAGVNTSLVYGKVDPDFAEKIGGSTNDLWAAGLSLIIHPKNPRVPTVHANFRMIHAGEKFWFGGGADLSPFYPYEEDFHYFHNVWKKACAPYGENIYSEWKAHCDQYFTNHHRDGEMRGVGGIFFDHYNTGDVQKDASMVMNLSRYFIPSFFPIANHRVNEAWSDEDEDFQLHRRGRYVEFNLLHDRGTKFGLQSNGRTDSILISLPARCKFTYRYAPKKGSPQEKMMSYYSPQEW